MTVPATTRRAGPFNGNGVANTFSFTFKAFATGDLLVVKTSTLGNESVLVLDSDYSVTLNVDQDVSPGGTVTYPITGAKLAAGEKLTVIGDLPYEQTTDLLGGGAFNARVIEDTFDRITIQIQQLQDQINRAIKFSQSDSSTLTSTLSTALVRANKYLVFDANGSIGASASDVEVLSAQAVSAAGNAAVSANAASASASAASTSASAASTSASSAAGTYASIQTTAASLAPTVTTFSGDGVQTVFTLPYAVTTENLIDIYIGGVYQQKLTYSVLGTTLTFSNAPPAGADIIEVITAANVTYTLPANLDYGVVTAAAGATADYGALV